MVNFSWPVGACWFLFHCDIVNYWVTLIFILRLGSYFLTFFSSSGFVSVLDKIVTFAVSRGDWQLKLLSTSPCFIPNLNFLVFGSVCEIRAQDSWVWNSFLIAGHWNGSDYAGNLSQLFLPGSAWVLLHSRE